MEGNILCFGMYSLYKEKMSDKQREMIKFRKTVTKDKRISEYIDFAFDYARRNRLDIFVEEDGTLLKVRVYLNAGVFYGTNKIDFIELIQRADDWFFDFLGYEKDGTFEVCLCFNKFSQKRIKKS